MTDNAHIAFVAGATGYTGQQVVRALRRRGVRTIAHVRPDSSRRPHFEAEWSELGAEADSTAWEPEAMAARIRELKPTLVFGLLGTTKARVTAEKKRGGPGLGYEAVDYGMTMMVLEGCRRVDPPPRFVYLSALGVRETSPGSYYHARWKVETALRGGRRAGTDGGVRRVAGVTESLRAGRRSHPSLPGDHRARAGGRGQESYRGLPTLPMGAGPGAVDDR